MRQADFTPSVMSSLYSLFLTAFLCTYAVLGTTRQLAPALVIRECYRSLSKKPGAPTAIGAAQENRMLMPRLSQMYLKLTFQSRQDSAARGPTLAESMTLAVQESKLSLVASKDTLNSRSIHLLAQGVALVCSRW